MASTSSGYQTTALPEYDNGSQLENLQDFGVHSHLFIMSDITDTNVGANVMDPIQNNLLDKGKRAFIRFHSNKRVNNPVLRDKFEKCRQKLLTEHKDPQEVYGFIQLPNGDHGEQDDLCAYGVRVGMNYRGELGDASKGVYLSRYADTCTPSAFINDQCIRILICKVLLGKSRKILPSTDQKTWSTAPDINFDSYTALSLDNLDSDKLSPLERYNLSLMYVYEYLDKNNTAERPTSIFPLSVVEIQCNKPGPDFLNILVPRNVNSIIWTGALLLQKNTLKHVTMHSHFSNIGRPRGLDILQFKVFVPYDTVSNCMPIKRLLQDDMIGALLRRPEIFLEDQMSPMYVQYFVLKCEECEMFDGLCTLMRRYELVAVNKLPSNTYLFLIPNGGLSMKLGLCTFNTASFHCISISARSANMTNVNWQTDSFDSKSLAAPLNNLIPMNKIRARFLQHIPPPVPNSSLKQIATSPIFNIPPPNFSIPPPQVQSPSFQPRFMGPVRIPPPKAIIPKNEESVTNTSKIAPLSSIHFANQNSGKKVNATLQDMDRLLNEIPSKNGKSISSNVRSSLDPRLASRKNTFDSFGQRITSPPNQSTPTYTYVASGEEDMEIDEDSEATKLESTNEAPVTKSVTDDDLKSLLHNGKWFGQGNEKSSSSTRPRSRSPSSDEDRLQIIDDFSPSHQQSPEIKRKRLAVDEPQDIDLRFPTSSSGSNGQSSFAPSTKPNPTPNFQQTIRPSRFGPRAPTMNPPSLVVPKQLGSNQRQFFAPPPLNPPSLSANNSVMNRIMTVPLVVIPDPELFISPVLRPEQLEQIFSRANEINTMAGDKRIVFKWHKCINDGLKKHLTDASNTFLAKRAKRFIEVEQMFVNLIDPMPNHLCDSVPRTDHKYLICGLNVKRFTNNERVIFLSALITPASTVGPNFANHNIELCTPEDLSRIF